jgi:hypothetical protein
LLALSYTEAVKINYYALVVSILNNCIPETAFEKVQSDKPSVVKNQITDDDLRDMLKLREQGVFYKDLEWIYCMDKSAIHVRLKRFCKRRYK